MIKCEKCGKLYDYEKTYGICPNCARYNRKESNVATERDLHRKYDSNPWAHMADSSHRETHRVNQDTYRHAKDEYASAHRTYSGEYASRQKKQSARSEGRRKRSVRPVGLIVAILVIFMVAGTIISAIGEIVGFGGVSSAVEGLAGRFTGDESGEGDDVEPGRENTIYADNVWASYIGHDLSDSAWHSSLIVNEDELAELEKRVLPDDEVYYLVTAYVKNNTSEDYDLMQAQFGFQTEDDRIIPCLKVFDNHLSAAGANGSGYIDCLIAVPEDLEGIDASCTLNGQTETFYLYLSQE